LGTIQFRKAFDQRMEALWHIRGLAQRFAEAFADSLANSVGMNMVDLNIRNVAM
jgi:hypothetical protein